MVVRNVWPVSLSYTTGFKYTIWWLWGLSSLSNRLGIVNQAWLPTEQKINLTSVFPFVPVKMIARVKVELSRPTQKRLDLVDTNGTNDKRCLW